MAGALGRMVNRSALVFLSLLASSTAQSQDMIPISQVANVNASATFVRCAGLYYALYEWAGPEQLGDTASDVRT